MEFNSIMHVTFWTNQMEEMTRFYTEVLGGDLKIVTRARAYRDMPKSSYYPIYLEDPEQIIIEYIELAPLQFVELFPATEGQMPHGAWNDRADYSHFALTCDDIFATRERLESRGLVFDTAINKGPSGTYQMWAHDPDDNRFEIMQFIDESYQIVGHIM